MMLNREQIAGFFFLLFDESFEFKGYKKVSRRISGRSSKEKRDMERSVSPSKIICENNVKKLLTNVGTGGIIAKSLMTSRRIRLLNGEKHCWFRKKDFEKS